MKEKVLIDILINHSNFDEYVLKNINTQTEINRKLVKILRKQGYINLLLFWGLMIVGSELVKMKQEMDKLKESKCGKGVQDEC